MSAEGQQDSMLGRWLALMASLPLLYILSVGPVLHITKKSESDRTIGRLRAFYGPVIWLHDHTPLKGPLEAYVSLWGVH